MRGTAAAMIAGLCAAAGQALTEKPVVGILSQELSDTDRTPYIAASYVKWAESSGARVVPIQYNVGAKNLTDTFKLLNGIIFPGGGADLSPGAPFYESAKTLYNLVLKSNEEGDPVPLWCTCLGFETLAILAAKNHSALQGGTTQFDSYYYPIPLDFKPTARQSRLFGNTSVPDALYAAAAAQNITMNNHHMGIEPDHFNTFPGLRDNYTVISTNVDRKGRPFVSTIEHKSYPIYGVQWHPEKNAFEWTSTEPIPHSREAVQLMQAMGDRFMIDVRKNRHAPQSEAQLEEVLIYNWAPEYTGRGPDGSAFEQKYIFADGTGGTKGAKGEVPRGAVAAIAVGTFFAGIGVAALVAVCMRSRRSSHADSGFVMAAQ